MPLEEQEAVVTGERFAVVANPGAGHGAADARFLDATRRSLSQGGTSCDVFVTCGAGDARRHARQSAISGADVVVAVGGDGTINEVVNGLIDAGRETQLAIVAAGSGNDFIRTFGIPAEREAACAVARAGHTRTVDVVLTETAHGSRYFCNVGEVGFGGLKVEREVHFRQLPGKSRYPLSFWLTLLTYRPGTARIEVDGGLAYEGRAVNIVLGNAAFFGTGMRISPRSDPSDGALDVLVFRGPMSDALLMAQRMKMGTHVPNRDIVELRGTAVRVLTERSAQIEADGETFGRTPATFTVRPQAVALRVP